jgi:hypothetical protein
MRANLQFGKINLGSSMPGLKIFVGRRLDVIRLNQDKYGATATSKTIDLFILNFLTSGPVANC